MPDTFTPNLNLDLPPISAYDLFGAKINANFTAIDTAALMLAGTPLSPTAPTTGQVLTFNGTSWTPETSAGGSIGGGGTANQVTYFTAATTVASSASLGWDPTNKILSVSTDGAGVPIIGIPLIASVGDGVSAAVVAVTYGGSDFVGFAGFRANGSAATPSPATAGQSLVVLSGTGYNGSTFPLGTSGGTVRLSANENWSGTAQGTNLQVSLCQPGTTIPYNALWIDTGGAGGAARTGLGGNQSPAYAVDATGDANVSGVYRVGGTQIATTNLSDVSGAPTNGQVLTWNSTDSKWEPATPSGGGGAATGLATTGSPVGVGAAAPPTPGQALIATSATTATWQAVTASAAGSDTQVQFNSSGSLGASPNFTFTPSTSHLSILSASGACLDLDPGDRIFSIARENLIGSGTFVNGVTVQVAVDSSDGGDNAVFSAVNFGTASRFWALHSQGSFSAPTPPVIGDTMMDVSAIGFTSYFDIANPGGSMKLFSTAVWNVADHGTSWEVDLCPTTGSTTQYPALFAMVTGPNAAQVGVNTATPAYTLDVAGDANVSGVYRVGGNQIKTTNLSDVSGTPTNGQVLTWNSTDSKWEPATPSGGGGSSSGSPGDIQFAGATSGLFASNDANLFWDNTNHRLGIGTNSPTWPLTTLATGNQIGSTNYYAVGNVGSSLNGVTVGYNNSDGSGIISAGVSTSNDLAFWSYNSGWAERVRFAASGRIGIGTASPATPLDVNGAATIRGSLTATGASSNNLYWDSANNALGVGGTDVALGYPAIEAVGDSSPAFCGSVSFGGRAPIIGGLAAGGTPGSPTAVQSGYTLAAFAASGYDGAVWVLPPSGGSPGGLISFTAAEDWATGAHGTSLKVSVVAPTTTSLQTAIFAQGLSGGGAQVGVNTATPAYTLDVSGSINFTDDLLYNGQPFLSGFQVTATYAAGITQSFSFPTSLTGGSIINMTPAGGGSANVAMTGFTPSVPLITGGVGTFTVTYTADPGSAPTVIIIVGGR